MEHYKLWLIPIWLPTHCAFLIFRKYFFHIQYLFKFYIVIFLMCVFIPIWPIKLILIVIIRVLLYKVRFKFEKHGYHLEWLSCCVTVLPYRWVRHCGGCLPDNSRSFRKRLPTNWLTEEQKYGYNNKVKLTLFLQYTSINTFDLLIVCRLNLFNTIYCRGAHTFSVHKLLSK